MPFHSQYPPITVPPVDLWEFLFENVDREFPEHHIVYVDVEADKKHTFSEIKSSAEQFGQGLQVKWGWCKGDILALMTSNSTNVAVVSLGTLYAGGVVCPINNLSTVDELVQSLKASSARAIATNNECLKVAREAATVVGIPQDRILLINESEASGGFKHFTSVQTSSQRISRPQINPAEDVAFLVYSSGTTGLPKGVMLTHQNIIANIVQAEALEGSFSHWSRDRCLGFLPMHHIYGIAVLILGPLRRGVATYVMQRFDLEKFCKIVQDNQITVAYIVPPVALALAKSQVLDRYDLSSLRALASSAAPAPKEILEGIYRRLGAMTKQSYGLSEASPAVAIQALEEWNKPIGSSGRLLPSMSMKIVLDGEEMQVGQSGELWLHGPNIFKGYHNNLAATTDAIDPEGWYRTGDIGHVDEKGNIFITDRLKELIKYNGFQVPPAQLEALLIGHPAVSDAAVVGVYSTERATELPRAYIVVAPGFNGGQALEQELHEWVNERVVPYKRLRGGIKFVETIPKSAAGKILRRVLKGEVEKEQETMPAKARL